MSKIIPLARAIVIILSMLIGQLPALALAAPAAEPLSGAALIAAPDAEGGEGQIAAGLTPIGVAEIPLRQDRPQECKIKVLAAAVQDYPSEPDRSQPPSGTTNPTPFGAVPVTEAASGDVLKIWVVVMNWTDDPGCATNEAITVTGINLTVAGQTPLPEPGWDQISLPHTMPAPGAYWEGRYRYEVSAFSPSEIRIEVTVDARDSSDALVQDEDKTWKVTVSSPGFLLMSFEPSVSTAAPGDLVDFTIRVQNTRPGVVIDNLTVESEFSQFVSQCSGIEKWTVGGSPITELQSGQIAECTIRNVVIPPSTETGEFRLTGTLTAHSGGAEPASAEVESDPVQIHQASIKVTKTVQQIIRGTQIVSEPAQPGDTIHYLITVENTSLGGIAVDHLTIQDSLTGLIAVSPSLVLEAGQSRPFNTQWTVLPNSQDPLTNRVSVTARAVNTGRTVSADAAVSVDIADSALEMELAALDPVTGQPRLAANVGDTVRFRMTLSNVGDEPITSLDYSPLGGTLRSYGTLPSLSGITLAPGGVRTLTWDYTILDEDPDPLVNTVAVKGMVGGRQLTVQKQVVVDVTNPNIEIAVTVSEPAATTVLRGGEVVYNIVVTNKSANPICNVLVSQLRVDPDTGQETPIIPAVPMLWPGATPGRLEGTGTGNEAASASTTYLVTSTDKDPLHMVFKVTASSSCEGGGELLSDRTSRVLNISDVQVNAEIGAALGPDGVATVGEAIQFTYLVTNVGTIPLSNVSATVCYPSRLPAEPPNCNVPWTPTNLQGGALLQFETATGIFTQVMTQADADVGQFPVEVTLYATDNRGRDVTLKTTTTIVVTTPDFLLQVTGPTEVVNGDTHNFSFTLTNDTNVDLTDVRVFLADDPDHPVATVATLSGVPGSNTFTGNFDHTINAPPGATTFELVLRATATKGDGSVIATGSHVLTLIPMITVDKRGPDVATPGEDVEYQITIKNNSNSQTFTADLDGLHDDVLAAYGVPVRREDFAWPGPVGVLGPGQQATATLTLPQVKADVSPLVNTFTVVGKNDASQAVAGIGQHEMDVSCPVLIRFDVTETVTNPSDPLDPYVHILHETLRWQITLVNITQSTLQNVVVTESLNWGGPVPGLPSTIGPNEQVSLPAFERPITQDYYSPSTEDQDYMTSDVEVTFSEVAGSNACSGQGQAPLFSPIGVIKTADPSLALTGDTVTYTLTLINLAGPEDPINTYTVTLNDPLLSANPIPMFYNGEGQPAVTSGEMGPGEVVTGPALTYVVKDSDPDKLVNTATAQFPDPGAPDVTFYTTGKAEVTTVKPLQLVKTPSQWEGIPGTTIYYSYELTNATEYTIRDLTLSDDRIDQLIPGPYTDLPGAKLTLGGFESFTISSVPYDIPIDAPNPLVNTATATYTIDLPGGPRTLTEVVSIAVNIKPPDIVIEKRVRDAGTKEPLPDDLPLSTPGGDGIVEGTVGQQVEYCFTVSNNSPSSQSYVDNIRVEDVMLGEGALQMWFEAAVEIAYQRQGAGSRRLYGGESVDFCYPVAITLNRALGDPLTNKVTLRGETPSGGAMIPVYTDDSLTIDLLGTDLLITKSASQPLAYIGQEVTYTVRIENRNQTYLIDNIELLDSFLGVVDPAMVDWSANANGGIPGSLGPGGYATLVYPYTIQPHDPDPLINSASVTGVLADGQGTEVEDSTQSSLAITPSQLLVRKFASASRALPGASVHYTIAITNVGQVPVYDLHVTDTRKTDLPAPTATDLMPNRTAYVYYDLDMPRVEDLAANPELDPYINTVTVEGTIYDERGIPQPDPVVGQSTATVDIIQPNVSISKVPQVEAATPGSGVDYTITIRNTGGAGDTLTDLIFTDVTAGVMLDLDSVCPEGPCPFVYGPEPYAGDGAPNPLDGQPYDPAHGLRHREMLIGTITVDVPPAGAGSEFTNVAAIQASLGDTTVQDRSSATIDVRQEGIRVEKVASTSTATIGEDVTYTIRVENTGTVPFTRLTIADAAMPGGTLTVTGGFPDTDGDAATLDPGEVYEHVYVHRVTPTDSDPYTNRASVSAFTSAGAVVINSAQTTVDIQLAELRVEKYVCAQDNPEGNTPPDPCTPVVNVADENPDEVFYYLRIYNPSIVPIQNITVSDSLVPSSTFDTIAWPQSPRALAPNDGAPGGPDEVWFKYAYSVADEDLDPLWNMVTVTGETPTTPPQTAQDVARASLRLVTGDLQLTKSGPAQAQVGETVTYSLAVTHLNPAGEPITNIQITDPLSPSGTAPVCTIASLAPGATDASCTFDYTVSLADPSPLVNQAFARGSQASAPGGTVTDTATHTLEIVTPGLSVTKTPSVTVATFGQTVTFTYVVRNTGQGAIDNLSVVDSDPQITFNAPWPTRLASGQTVIRTATRTLTPLDPDPYTNTVTVQGRRGGVTVRAQASATVALSDAALAVSNVPNRQYVIDGDPVTFAYTARNLGSEPIESLSFDDGGLCSDLGAQLPSTTLAPRSSVTVYCTVTAALPGPLVSTVRATGIAGAVPVSDTATAQVQVTSGGLVVTKTADRFVAAPGDVINYTITLTNIGGETLAEIQVFDPIVLLNPPPPASLLPGARFTMSGSYLVGTDPAPDSVANTVSVTAVGVDTQNTYQDSASVAVAILENPDAILALTKQASVRTARLRARPGDEATYTFTVRNVSAAQTAQDITVIDSQVGGAPIQVPPLGPGEAYTFARTVPIPADYADTTFVNVAMVHTGSEAEQTLQDTASASVDVQLLGLTKTAEPQDAFYTGDEVTYTFTVESFTQATLQGVVLDDEGLTFIVPLPDDIGPDGATASGKLQIPPDYTDTVFENTAQLLLNGQWVDEASARVTVVPRTLAIEDVSITQMDRGRSLTLIQTGEPATLRFKLRNVSSATIAGLNLNVLLDVPEAAAPVCTTEAGGPVPSALAVGGESTIVCTFTLPVGREYYGSGLNRLVEIRATGNAGGVPFDVSVSQPMTLVDLKLEATLTLDPPSAPSGEWVTFELNLTNAGASPIGCDPGDGDPLPCTLTVTSDDPELQPLLDGWRDELRGQELQPGDSLTNPVTMAYQILPGDVSKTFTVTASGGYHDEELDQALLDAYITSVDASADLVVEELSLEVRIVGADPGGTEENPTVTYRIEITNTSNVPLSGLTARFSTDEAEPKTWTDIGLDRLDLEPGAKAYGAVTVDETHEDPYTLYAVASGVSPGGFDVEGETSARIIPGVPLDALRITIEEMVQERDGVRYDGSELRPFQTGHPITITIRVTNDGQETITDVLPDFINDLDPGGICWTSEPPISSLGAGQSATRHCVYTPPVGHHLYPRGGMVDDTIRFLVSGRLGGEEIAGFGDSRVVMMVDLALRVVLSAEPTQAMPGEMVSFTVMVVNEGATPIGCGPEAPAGDSCHLTLSSVNLDLGAALQEFTASLRDIVLNPDGVRTVDVSLPMPQPAQPNQVFALYGVTVRGGYYDPALDNAVQGTYTAWDTSDASIVYMVPRLTLEIQVVPNPPIFGQPVTYTVTARNTGPIPVTIQSGGYQIIPLATTHSLGSLPLMSGGARPGAQGTGGVLNFAPQTVPVGGAATAILSKQEDQTGPYLFRATINGMGLAQQVTAAAELLLTPFGVGTPTPTVDPATLDPTATEPQVTKEPSAPNAQAGGPVTWTIRVRNGSTGVMSGVVVTDTVPASMVIASAATDRGQARVEGTQVIVDVGTLNPGETATITLNTNLAPTVSAPATVTNTACAARQGGPQICAVGNVSVGPGVGSLPATGLRGPSGAAGWRLGALDGIGLGGLLLLALSAHVSRRRTLLAVVFVLLALGAIGGAVALVLTSDDDQTGPEETAVPATPGADYAVVPGVESPIPTPYILPTPAGVRTLYIPKLGETFRAPIPILEVPIVNRQWDVSGLGYFIGWLEGTTWLERDWGNTVLAAHVQLDARTPGPFWSLDTLVPGDEIIIREGDLERRFVVTSTRKVQPDDWTVTAPTEGPVLTLVTCTDWNNAYGMFAQRLVVQAVPAGT